MFIQRGKNYQKMTAEVVRRHVDRLRALDDEGKIALCGVLKGYPGVAGMVLFRTDCPDEAEALCKQEPLVVEGYATYKLCAFQEANRENNYLL